jgi:hypothetical protein
MKRLALAGILPLVIAPALPANAAIHEMVSAFCSGGDVGVIEPEPNAFLEPPGVTNDKLNSFRRPPEASGVVVPGPFPPGPLIGSSPAAKYPEGTPVIGLNVSSADHPSEHCHALTTP